MAGLQVPNISMPDSGLTPSADTGERGPLATSSPMVVSPAKPPQHFVPSQGSVRGTCTSSMCRYLAQQLRSHIDATKNPCEDFYGYVCGKFRAHHRMSEISFEKERSSIRFLDHAEVPPSNQTAAQKAAGLYQACVSFVEGDRTETGDLVTWMTSLGLELKNDSRLEAFDPVEMIVRCSLDLGVPAILSFELHQRYFLQGKRGMKIAFSRQEHKWLKDRLQTSDSRNINHYLVLLHRYSTDDGGDKKRASRFLELEKELFAIAELQIFPKGGGSLIPVREFGGITKPYITSGEIVTETTAMSMIEYTNNTYGMTSLVYIEPHVLKFIATLLSDKYVGKKGLQYLVAWSVFKHLVDYTVPRLLRGTESPSYACYEHVGKAMRLALMSPYFQEAVKPETLNEVDTMFSNIRTAYREAFEKSSWVKGRDRNVALRKLANMRSFIGSPGEYLEPSYLEELYIRIPFLIGQGHFPDAPPDRLFPTWIKAVSLSCRQKWADQATHLYNDSIVRAHYRHSINSVVIPTGIISRPFFYDGGPPSLNYGGLGTVVGHEITHAYGIRGITQDDTGTKRQWVSAEFTREYTKRALCLRRSYKKSMRHRARQDVLKEELDTEELSALVGATVSYKAFSSLPKGQRRLTLVGLNITAEHLFFISYCTPLCTEYGLRNYRHAPYRSRCIVPFMNMPQFSQVFGCVEGERMNPKKKCSFW
ncbi:hypothetical protein HPB50_018842 [Hyalomma asiaticum]|uniref:Uncharacterized protein n=1 Tax=Hyalomma asiaticum TaxID=266040 RepID=A0ACB7SH79_HYAAI|nr:hypothetical protein HPB50_018842 [Hyalomma asiaticum]